MEVLRATAIHAEPYYSHGLRKTFLIDALKPTVKTTIPQEAADIGYEVDEEKFLARAQRQIQLGGLETEIPFGWPQSLQRSLVWEPSNVKEEDYVYLLTEDDKIEIETALEYFKSDLSTYRSKLFVG